MFVLVKFKILKYEKDCYFIENSLFHNKSNGFYKDQLNAFLEKNEMIIPGIDKAIAR